eukprot:g4132.t1
MFRDLSSVLQFLYDVVLGGNRALASVFGRMLWDRKRISTGDGRFDGVAGKQASGRRSGNGGDRGTSYKTRYGLANQKEGEGADGDKSEDKKNEADEFERDFAFDEYEDDDDLSSDGGLESRILRTLKRALPSTCNARVVARTQEWLRQELTGFLETVKTVYMLGQQENASSSSSSASSSRKTEARRSKKNGDRLVRFVERLEVHTCKKRSLELLYAARASIREEEMYAHTDIVDNASQVVSQSLLNDLAEATGKSVPTVDDVDDEAEEERKYAALLERLGSAHYKDEDDGLAEELRRLRKEQSPELYDGYFQIPTCRVTICSQRLVGLAKEALHEAQGGVSIESARILLMTARGVMDMYRAVAPVVHEKKIANDVRVPMLVHNDCLYLAHHSLFVAHVYRDGLPKALRPVCTLVDLCPPFRSMGEETYTQIIETQQKRLTEALRPFDDFMKRLGQTTRGAQEDAEREAMRGDLGADKAEISVKRSIRIMEELSLAWEGILPGFVFEYAVTRLAEMLSVLALDAVFNLRSLPPSKVPQVLHLLSLFLDLDGRLKSIELRKISLPWASLVEASELLAEYRSIADARSLVSSGKLSSLGEVGAKRILRLISVPMYV